MMSNEKVKVNRVRCRECNEVIESKHRHDFKQCSCGGVFVDGGTDYLRRGWAHGAAEDRYEELSEYEPAASQ
jgi:hypothetical protein